MLCAVRVTLCVSGIVRAVHQSSSKLGDTPLARLDLFESLPSRRFGCRASTTNSTAKSRSTSLYNARSSSRARCRALQLYSAPERSTALQLYSALHSTSSTPSLRILALLSHLVSRTRARTQRVVKPKPGPVGLRARLLSILALGALGVQCSHQPSVLQKKEV